MSNYKAGKRNPAVPIAKKIATTLGFDWVRFYEEPDSEQGQDSAWAPNGNNETRRR